MRVVLVLLGLAVAAAGGGLAFVCSGLADVAATSQHWPLTHWILSTAMESSVRRQARGIKAPSYLSEDSHVRAGAAAYDAMCATCHGAPAVEPGVVGKGLNPPPPDLTKEADDWSPEEIFWVTANGVRMTGMPAFGPSHSDSELWDVVALVKRLPRMSGAEYRALLPEPTEHQGHGHTHERRR